MSAEFFNQFDNKNQGTNNSTSPMLRRPPSRPVASTAAPGNRPLAAAATSSTFSAPAPAAGVPSVTANAAAATTRPATGQSYYAAPSRGTSLTSSQSSTTGSTARSIRSQPPVPRPAPTASTSMPMASSSSSVPYYNTNSAVSNSPSSPKNLQPQFHSATTVSNPTATVAGIATSSYYAKPTVSSSLSAPLGPSPYAQQQPSSSIAAAPSSDEWFSGGPSSSFDGSALTTDHTASYAAPSAVVSSYHHPTQQQQQPTVMNPYLNNNAAVAPIPPFGSSSLEGSMDTSAPFGSSTLMTTSTVTPSIFMPNLYTHQHDSKSGDLDDFLNEPPLLEELGVNLEHIYLKTKAVVIPFRRFAGNSALMDPSVIVEDADLAGPLVFALLLGCELLLTVKMSFGYIYGFGLAGCVCMTLILNLMSPTSAVSFWTVTSILGYALLPVNLLAALKILLQNLAGQETMTRICALLTIAWCTTASTRLFEVGCGMASQRYLIAYPIAMLYTAFVMITIF